MKKSNYNEQYEAIFDKEKEHLKEIVKKYGKDGVYSFTYVGECPQIDVKDINYNMPGLFIVSKIDSNQGKLFGNKMRNCALVMQWFIYFDDAYYGQLESICNAIEKCEKRKAV